MDFNFLIDFKDLEISQEFIERDLLNGQKINISWLQQNVLIRIFQLREDNWEIYTNYLLGLGRTRHPNVRLFMGFCVKNQLLYIIFE